MQRPEQSEPFLLKARREFHAELPANQLRVSEDGDASVSDKGSTGSKAIAALLVRNLSDSVQSGPRLPGQIAGAKFEGQVLSFLKLVFPKLGGVRSGAFEVRRGKIFQFEQYQHLKVIAAATKKDRELRMALGSHYLIKPDIVVTREPETDAAVNAVTRLVDKDLVALHASIRTHNNSLPILHASISCKWTIRSDRAQNSRSEALNLIRHRKGRLPHIAVVTGEPLPTRISSIALGTGDLDCTYHIALNELHAAVAERGGKKQLAVLDEMIEGRRLRDIADLPLDLAV